MNILNILIQIVGALGTIVALGALAYQIRQNRISNRKKQASAIAAWILDDMIENGKAVVLISNMSELPIYEVVISRDLIYIGRKNKKKNNKTEATASNCTYIQAVPPGLYKAKTVSNGSGMHAKYGASITFRDANGEYWNRDASGQLKSIRKTSIEYREMGLPVDSVSIENGIEGNR